MSTMSTMKELIEKYHLPKNTTGVQVSNCLGITAYVRRVIRGYFKDCKVMYRGKDIYITVPSADAEMKQYDNEEWKDVDIRDKEGNINYKIPEGYWIINLDNKRLIMTSEERLHEELSKYDISNWSNG